MKKSILLALALAPLFSFSQTFKALATDGTGDDYPGRMDATELAYTLSTNGDSLYVKITHATARGADFGFALILDTNLNPNDGQPVNQTNMFANPNNSMKYDLLLYAYQNSIFPTVYTEAYGPSGSPVTLSYELDTVDPNFSIFRIPLAALGGNIDFNLVGFTGGFDISGSGPSDAVPNSTYAEIRESQVGLTEFAALQNVYPNPAHDFFKLDYNGLVKIYNLQGALVKEIISTPGEPIDCAGLQPSVYHLIFESGKAAGKLIIH